ncbi:MAG: hypothetical protein Kow00128_19580 [Deltaproteobacteria bacterium]
MVDPFADVVDLHRNLAEKGVHAENRIPVYMLFRKNRKRIASGMANRAAMRYDEFHDPEQPIAVPDTIHPRED